MTTQEFKPNTMVKTCLNYMIVIKRLKYTKIIRIIKKQLLFLNKYQKREILKMLSRNRKKNSNRNEMKLQKIY